MNESLGIYIHIPFCVKKCNYCDFYSLPSNEFDLYAEAVIQEIENYEYNETVDTIYFGGGTPNLMPTRHLGMILDSIKNKASDCEISIEANPGLDTDYSELRKLGFNRLSLGIQSLNDNELRTLGRIHDTEIAKKEIGLARRAFDNINIDVMYNLPEQTSSSFSKTLNDVLAFTPEHISAYSLIIEEGTPFYNQKLNLPSEDGQVKIENMLREKLGEYVQYEISNYARKGLECKHNLKYWNLYDYIGFGAGAHSNVGNLRWENSKELFGYQKSVATISTAERMSEFVFLGLRKIQGISKKRFSDLFGTSIEHVFNDQLEKYIGLGFIVEENDYLRFSRRGFEISNSILADFI